MRPPSELPRHGEHSPDDTSEMAALVLSPALHAKYDLVALMKAAIDMITEAKNG